MALNVQQGTVALSTATNGDVTVSLPAGFDLKAIHVHTVGATADAQAGQDITYPRGWGTNFGGTIQQVYTTGFSKDGSASIDAARGSNTTAILKGFSAGTPTVSYVVALQAWAATSFTLRSTTAPATAIRVQYLALGGSDIEAACAIQFLQATAVATQDVTVATGFGKPSLLILDHSGATAAGDATSHWRVGRGAAVPGTGYQSNHQTKDGAATGEIASYVTANLIGTITSGAAIDAIADLPADQSAAPADGFRLAYSDQSSLTYVMGGLAIRGATTFKPTVVTSAASTGAAGATTTLAGATGSTAKGALFFGNTEAASTAIVTAGTGMGGAFTGATDGTNHGATGITQQDANAAAVNGAFDTTTHAIRFATAGATPATQSEATAALSGADIVLTWPDTDTVARVFHAVVFGTTDAGGDATAIIGRATSTAAGRTVTISEAAAAGRAGTTAAGRTVLASRSSTAVVGRAASTATGQVVTVSRSSVAAVTRAGSTAAGRSIVTAVSTAVPRAAATATGRTVTASRSSTAVISRAAASATGRTVTVSRSSTAVVTRGAASATGRAVATSESAGIGRATATAAGRTVTPTEIAGAGRAASTATGRTVTVARSTTAMVGRGAATAAGRPVLAGTILVAPVGRGTATATGRAVLVSRSSSPIVLRAAATATGRAPLTAWSTTTPVGRGASTATGRAVTTSTSTAALVTRGLASAFGRPVLATSVSAGGIPVGTIDFAGGSSITEPAGGTTHTDFASNAIGSLEGAGMATLVE